MIEKNEIMDELRGISIVIASISKTNVFTVPENYFEKLAERITVYTYLNKDEKPAKETMQIPEGYFDTLSDNILSKIKEEEEANSRQSEVLAALKDKNVFTVPDGYFEGLSDNILKKIHKPEAKVIPISQAKTWWKYAAAAVVTAAIAVSSLQIFYTAPEIFKKNTLAKQTVTLPGYIESSFQYKTAREIDEGIASLSREDIASYLEKNGNILDDEALAGDVNEGELPSEMDYLTDENALNNYLKSLNAPAANK